MPAILTFALLSIPLIGAYAIFALGISVIYRASRVLNLAHGAMAMIPAYLCYSLVQAGVPIGVSLPLGVASGAGLGVAVEVLFVRRLRAQGSTAQTVGTVAVTGLLIAIAAKIWGTTPLIAPKVFGSAVFHIGGSGIRAGDIGLFATGVVVSLALFTFFKRTQFGLAMRGAAQNRRAASLMGIDPDRAAMAAWALGGGLAALAGIMLAAVTILDPYTLSLQVLPAFVAALIGGLESLPGALGGSTIAGLSFGLVPYFAGTPVIGSVVRFSGAPQLALTILTLVVMATRGRRLSGAQEADVGLATGERKARPPDARRARRRLAWAIPVLVVWPWVVPFSVLGDSLLAMELGLVGISLVVLTGWVGQISLAQASFVGVAALSTGLLSRGMSMPFPLSLVAAAAIAAGVAAVLGVVALRVRGLYLAVATLIFAWMCDSFLFRTPWMGASSGSSTIPDQVLGARGGWPVVDLVSRRTLYYVMAVIVAAVVYGLANLRDTKTGRAFAAVRGSEMAAVSLGIDVVRLKLIAFALSGALAGIAGNLLMMDLRTVVPGQFVFTVSLQYLAIAVVGGLGSIGGALGAGALFAALNELFLRVPALSGWLEVVSAAALTTVLLVYPGGLAALADRLPGRPRALDGLARAMRTRANAALAQVASAARARLSAARFARPARARDSIDATTGDWLTTALHDAVRSPARAPRAETSSGGGGDGTAPAGLISLELGSEHAAEPLGSRADRAPVLEARSITVRFGGLTAVDDASLEVREREIVGLIGPNGAGKTTLFNAILGLNDPASGSVRLYGHDATGLGPHERARLGVARTFQVIQLFGGLSVSDNLLVATHGQNRSGVLSNLAASASTLHAERAARERVDQVLALLGLTEIAGESVRGLPFGVLRMIELGRALVTGARLVMLDEPASGLNEAETDRLAEVVTGVRALGVSVLVIEHDVRMVTSISDHLYVLNQGRMLTDGEPAAVQRHPEVVAAYLGTPAGDVVVDLRDPETVVV